LSNAFIIVESFIYGMIHVAKEKERYRLFVIVRDSYITDSRCDCKR